MSNRAYEYVFIFCFGAIGYSLIEIIFRGYTHWTMVITGGIVFFTLYYTNTRLIQGSIIKRSIIGSALITGVEFTVGYLVNIIFKMDVWDYSDKALNVMGQICPLFTLLWFLLCIPIIPFCLYLQRIYFDEEYENIKK